MKKSDWALVILIIGMTGFFGYLIIGAILPNPKNDTQTVPTAEIIRPDIDEPSKEVFNSSAINPTVRTLIGEQSNQSPFTLGGR